MFWGYFQATGVGVLQIFLLGAVGFLAIKAKIVSSEGLNSISRYAIEIALPVLIFCQMVKDFSFTLYPGWWVFPLISFVITVAGLLCGLIFCFSFREAEKRMQFLSLVAFQNSGYLPLAMIAALLPPEKSGAIFIYLFLFLAGFNMVMFSLGVHMLSFHKNRRFELGSLFSPPVVAVIVSLIFIYFKGQRVMPQAVMKPLVMVGDSMLPLAMFVVGANLAQIRLKHVDRKAVLFLALAKLIMLPCLGLIFLMKVRVPELVGLLIMIELAVPSATLLSVITRHYNKEDILVSQGIFFSHIVSLITIPLFLSLYFTLVVVR